MQNQIKLILTVLLAVASFNVSATCVEDELSDPSCFAKGEPITVEKLNKLLMTQENFRFEINTLKSEVNTLKSEVNTLKSQRVYSAAIQMNDDPGRVNVKHANGDFILAVHRGRPGEYHIIFKTDVIIREPSVVASVSHNHGVNWGTTTTVEPVWRDADGTWRVAIMVNQGHDAGDARKGYDTGQIYIFVQQ